MAEPYINITSKATWTADGGGVETDLYNESWSFTSTGAVVEAPNTTDGINRGTSREDCEASVEGSYYSDHPIHDVFWVGDTGTLKLYLETGGGFISFHALVGEDLEFETGDDGEVLSWTASFMLKSGPVTRPV
jgi:hypothetical protein